MRIPAESPLRPFTTGTGSKRRLYGTAILQGSPLRVPPAYTYV